MKKWTIQIVYDFRDDKDRKRKATTVYHTEAADILSAYKDAEQAFKSHSSELKIGGIMPGHHMVWP